MRNAEVARQLELMADVLEHHGESPLRIRAYRRAARSLASLSEDVESIARADRLEDTPGIGADPAARIREYLRTGTIEDTAAASRDRKLARRGTERRFLEGLRLIRGGQERMPLGEALPIGRELALTLERLSMVERVGLAGSIRRMTETVGDIDILVTSSKPAAVMQAFVTLPQVAEVLQRGITQSSIRHRAGIQVDLRVVAPACFGAALVYFTGSKAHNLRLRKIGARKGLEVSKDGVFSASTGRRLVGKTEEAVYRAIGLPWIPPELREDTGEIEAALRGKLPDLLELDEIRGDLHCHTSAAGGQPSIEALVTAAERRGYRYVAVTDHSRSMRVAGGLSLDALGAHVEKIRAVQARHPGIRVLAGSECDIRPDGSLDYPDRVLAELDLVIGSVHSTFRQSRAEMTRRICRALAHPRVHVLGHPTGRLIGGRDPYAVDIEEVLRTARRHDKAVEISADPDRLDLNDLHARRARALDVLVAVSSDAHALAHLGWMELGVATARRGWIETRRVVNSWPPRKLLAWLRADGATPTRKAHRSRRRA